MSDCLNEMELLEYTMPGSAMDELELIKTFMMKNKAKIEHEERFGSVRPPVHFTFQGHKVVAAGGHIHISPRWLTFADFLSHYPVRVIGADWFGEEAAKPSDKKHILVNWFETYVRIANEATPEPGRVYNVSLPGPCWTYVNLAYDLFVIEDNAELQKRLVSRLKQPDQFQGARYELLVAATMVRAGFSITFHDESDSSVPHAEFRATCKGSGQMVDVEAKSRHRQGTYGYTPGSERERNHYSDKPAVSNVLRRAAKKAAEAPLIVFVELNLPLANLEQICGWMSAIDSEVDALDADFGGGKSPFGATFFTNSPYGYNQPDAETPTFWSFMSPSIEQHIARGGKSFVLPIHDSLRKYGNIPGAFEGYTESPLSETDLPGSC